MKKQTRKLVLHRETLVRLHGAGRPFTGQNTVIDPEPQLTDPASACTIPIYTYPWC